MDHTRRLSASRVRQLRGSTSPPNFATGPESLSAVDPCAALLAGRKRLARANDFRQASAAADAGTTSQAILALSSGSDCDEVLSSVICITGPRSRRPLEGRAEQAMRLTVTWLQLLAPLALDSPDPSHRLSQGRQALAA
jgi:hypothetical protein